MAYLVFHDNFDQGAMDVYPACCVAHAEKEAERRNNHIDALGYDEAGHWRGYEVLPAECEVYKRYENQPVMTESCGGI